MERLAAIEKLKELEGRDLVPLASQYGVTIWKTPNKKNKGWAGHVIERYLGLPINSSRAPNFGSWELKIVPLKRLKNGKIKVKKTMAITMIDRWNFENTNIIFEKSHLLQKLRKMVVCARMFESKRDESSVLARVSAFDLDDNRDDYDQVERDYEEVKNCIKTKGFEYLSGKMGVFIQPRTKGRGHGSTSRAFYARAPFVAKILGIDP